MTVFDYGITVDGVVSKTPIDATQIGPDTTPVNNSDIEEHILDRAAEASGVLAKGGITEPEDLDDTTTRQVKLYVRTAAALDVIDKMGFTDQQQRGELASQRDRAWRTLNNPQLLRDRRARMRSNVDTRSTPPRGRDFTGDYSY